MPISEILIFWTGAVPHVTRLGLRTVESGERPIAPHIPGRSPDPITTDAELTMSPPGGDPTHMRMAAATLAAPAAGSSSLRLDNRGPSSLNLGELWAHRELLYFLAWRDIKVRYKQTVLGLAWAVLQPLAMMLLFSFFFGRLAHVPSDGVPYPAFAYSGLALWLYFAAAVGRGSNCLLENSPLLTKVYFPRLLVPAASVLFGLPDLAMASILALALLAFFGIGPTAALLLVIPFALLATVVAFGVSVWLAALNVRYRDVRYVVPVLIQLWMFVSPV